MQYYISLLFWMLLYSPNLYLLVVFDLLSILLRNLEFLTNVFLMAVDYCYDTSESSESGESGVSFDSMWVDDANRERSC